MGGFRWALFCCWQSGHVGGKVEQCSTGLRESKVLQPYPFAARAGPGRAGQGGRGGPRRSQRGSREQDQAMQGRAVKLSDHVLTGSRCVMLIKQHVTSAQSVPEHLLPILQAEQDIAVISMHSHNNNLQSSSHKPELDHLGATFQGVPLHLGQGRDLW